MSTILEQQPTTGTAPTASVSSEILRELAEELIASYPECGSRILRAVSLAVMGYVQPSPTGHGWHVRSQCLNSTHAYYVPTLRPYGCPCRDGLDAPRGRCKHSIAVFLAVEGQRRERALAARYELTDAGLAALAETPIASVA